MTSRRPKHPWLLPALILLACGWACAPVTEAGGRTGSGSVRAKGRGVLVIVLDALRYDHTTSSGYDRDTTPRLAAFAGGEGTYFTNAWATAPNLIPSHVSLLTGCDPAIAHRPMVVLSSGKVEPPLTNWFIPKKAPRLAKEFLADGWRTAAFVDHAHIGASRGFKPGFRDYFDVGGEWGSSGVTGLSGVTRRFYEWMSGLDEDQDWMAYIHWNDLEALWNEDVWGVDVPYLVRDSRYTPRPELDFIPPTGNREPIHYALPPSRLLRNQPTLAEYEMRYDTVLRSYLDRNIGRLFNTLEDDGRWDTTTVVVLGSFGIGFGESGFLVASGSYSEVDLHVPLMIRPAPSLEIPRRGPQHVLVSLLDVAPTLLELVGIPQPAGMHGRSMVPLLKGKADSVRESAFASHGVCDGFAVIEAEHIFSLTRPGSRGPGPLSDSWFGDGGPHRSDEVLVLKDLRAQLRPGNLGFGVEDPQNAARMRGLGENWYRDLDRAREVLHPSPWNEAKRGAATILELQSRGLIGPQ